MAKIIVADDNKLLLLTYSKVIDYLGHEAKLCPNGTAAYEAYQQSPADMLVLDFDMPGMTGLEVCAAIRKLPEGLKVPIVVISSHDDEETIINCLNAGANDYLTKPVKEAHLIAKIKNHLQTASLHKNDFDLAKNQAVIAGRFKITRLLGYGSHSVVFLAQDTAHAEPRPIAIKLLNQNLDARRIAEMFAETAARMQTIESDFILKVYEHGEYSGRLFTALEYAEGGDLAVKLKSGDLPEHDAIQLAIEITHALKALEKNGLAHLDIKPENIMLAAGHYKLADFGFLSGGTREGGGTMALGAELWSTAAYMAPEYYMSGAVDIRSDIYSLGVTLYKALTGENHFEAEKPAVSMYRQLNFTPPSIREYNKNLSHELATIVARMLVKDPAQRPSLDELMASLTETAEKIRQGTATHDALPPSPVEQPTASPLPHSELIGETGPTDAYLADKVKRSAAHIALLKTKPGLLYTTSAAFASAAIALAISAILGYLIFSIFIAGEKDTPGAIMLVACEKCGVKEARRVTDITSQRCATCGAMAGHAMKCLDCGKEFAWRPTPIDDAAEKEAYLAHLDEQMKCPSCKSLNTDYLTTNAASRPRPPPAP